ncbi:MAG: hypothetical protein IIZ94_15035 [Prevotella sp.]|nr:hypothetical protein [Prevotella sp.]
MLFLIRLGLSVALPACISALTVVAIPPILVFNPAVPVEGSMTFVSGNTTLIPMTYFAASA